MNSNFNGFSNNQMKMMQTNHNFNQAFQNSNNLIPELDVNNHGNLVHNNIKSKIFCENLEQYTLFIDGSDKNNTNFPNSFEFTAQLGYDNSKYISLGHNLENIKYIKLKHVILPKYNKIKDVNNEYVYDTTELISDKNRFLVLNIDEINDINTFKSGIKYKDNCFILRSDKNMGNDHQLYVPIERDIIHYKDSSLSNLSKMTIKLCDDIGNVLTTQLEDNLGNIEINADINKKIGEQDLAESLKTSLEEIFKKHHIQLTFEIGVMENEIATKITY